MPAVTSSCFTLLDSSKSPGQICRVRFRIEGSCVRLNLKVMDLEVERGLVAAEGGDDDDEDDE